MPYRNKYFWFFVVTIVGYGVFEYLRPKPIDWTFTCANKDKIPFGSKATFELLKDVFPNQDVKSTRLPIYNHLKDSKLPKNSSYVFVNQRFDLDKNDRRLFLEYIAKGNTAFVSTYDMPDTLTKQLGFEAALKAPKLRDTALVLNFVNPILKNKSGYVFKHDDGRNYFKILDAKKVVVLAENKRKEPIFLKTAYGKGSIFWHNMPMVFTNYYVLDNQMSDFAFKSLSYLPNQPVFWDEYQKQGRFDEEEGSILRYIMRSPALSWSYYIVLFGLLAYVIFAGKRTQRIIPVVEAPKNTSLEFVETIGRMYYQQADHPNLAQKKIQHFWSYVRDKFGLKTNVIDDDFKEILAQKSGKTHEDVNELIEEIRKVEKNPYLTDYQLIALSQKIENFRKK